MWQMKDIGFEESERGPFIGEPYTQVNILRTLRLETFFEPPHARDEASADGRALLQQNAQGAGRWSSDPVSGSGEGYSEIP